MTDRRPPKEASPTTPIEPDDGGHVRGTRSQTVPLGSGSGRGATPPRSTFSAQPGHNPAADKSAQRPAPNAWGATLLVGNMPPPPDESAARRGPPAQEAHPTPAEPLRMPSNRPSPAPWQESRGQEPRGQQPRAARTGTLLMPGAADPELQAAIAASRTAVGATADAKPEPSARTGDAGGPRSAAPEPRPQARTAAQPSPAAGAAPASAPAAPANRSEPLHLNLDARDIVPNSSVSMSASVVPRRGPLIVTAIVGALVLIAAVAWMMQRPATAASPAAVAVDGTRSSSLPAAPVAAAPERAAAESDTQKPAAAPAQPATPAQRAPVAAPESEKPAPVAAKPSVSKKRRAKKPSKPSANSESIDEAREALKALASPPVVRVKRKADDDEGPPAIEQREPPAPPAP